MKGEGKVKKAIKESFKILNEVKCVLVFEGRNVQYIHMEIWMYQTFVCVCRQRQKAGGVYVTRQSC